MKKSKTMLFLLSKDKVLFILFICTLQLSPLLSSAQNEAAYKIAIYEKNDRKDTNFPVHLYKYEIRSLFVKSANEWVKNFDSSTEDYFKVFNGKIYGHIKGECCTMERRYDTSGNEISPIKEYGFLKPTPTIALSENYLFKPFKDNEGWLISKAALLSNNANFERNIQLKQYSPSFSDLEILKDSVKIYLTELYVSNKACNEGFNSMNIDTLINKVVNPINKVSCDPTNSFIDDKHNKIINLLVPAAFIYNSFYPFNEDCFREDNRFKYFRILCYISNTGKISFLYDNLRYLDHGDFDGDGKDEFLFWYTSHHKDGYVMFYDDFSKKAENMWTYQ